MAVALVSTHTAVSSGNTTALTIPSVLVSPGDADRCMLVFMAYRTGSGQTLATVRWHPDIGVQYDATFVFRRRLGSINVELWSLIAPVPHVGASGNVIATLTGGQSAVRMVGASQVYSGVHQTIPIIATTSQDSIDTGNLTNPTLSVNSPVGDMMFCAISPPQSGSPTLAPNSSETEDADIVNGGTISLAARMQVEHRAATGAAFLIGQAASFSISYVQIAGAIQAQPSVTSNTQTAAINAESLFNPRVLAPVNTEARGSVISQANIDIESLVSLITAQSLLNIEALVAIQRAQALNLEALIHPRQTAPINLESRGAVRQTRILNIESQQRIALRTQILNIESRFGVRQTSLLNIEAVSAAIGVSQSAIINVEALTHPRSTGLLNLESIVNVTRQQILNLESRMGLNRQSVINVEAKSGVVILTVGLIDFEALQGIRQTSGINVESYGRTSRALVLNIESRLGNRTVAIINVESQGTASAPVFLEAGLPWFFVDPAQYKGVSFYFEAQLQTNDAVTPKIARARLEYSDPTGVPSWTPLVGSEVSSIATSRTTPVRSPALTLPTGLKMYRVTFGGTTGMISTIFSGGMRIE